MSAIMGSFRSQVRGANGYSSHAASFWSSTKTTRSVESIGQQASIGSQAFQCPQGHPLVGTQIGVTSPWDSLSLKTQSCNVCSKDALRHGAMYRCDECDYHICQSCDTQIRSQLFRKEVFQTSTLKEIGERKAAVWM